MDQSLVDLAVDMVEVVVLDTVEVHHTKVVLVDLVR